MFRDHTTKYIIKYLNSYHRKANDPSAASFDFLKIEKITQ